MKEYEDTYLLTPFREFYTEVIRLKPLALRDVMVAPDAGARGGGAESEALTTQAAGTRAYFPDLFPGEAEEEPGAWDSPPGARRLPWATSKRNGGGGARPAAAGDASLTVPAEIKSSAFIWKRLVALLESNALSYGGLYGAQYKETQYVMAALADEIFLTIEDWEGHSFWLSNLIESRIFNTHIAGDLFFRRLDHLLAERDPIDRPLGAVYLMALSLGFRGKYRPRNGRTNASLERDRLELESYRRQLYRWVFRCEPGLDEESHHLFPEAYGEAVRGETKRRLTSPRAWIILLCVTVLAYITLTHLIWINLTGRLFEVNKQIESHVEDLGHKR